jgi:hypothetical protein
MDCGVKQVLPTASQSASVGVVALMNWKSLTVGCGIGYAALALPDPVNEPATTAKPPTVTASATALSNLRFMVSPLTVFSDRRGYAALLGD